MEEKETMEKELSSAPTDVTEENSTATEPSIEAQPITESSVEQGEAPSVSSDEPKKKDADEKPMSKKRRIFNAVMLAVQIILVVIALTITMVVIFNPKKNEIAKVGYSFLPVESDSMDGDKKDSFKEGDIVITKAPKNGATDLKVGDIVTFEDWDANGTKFYNTHRIVEVRKEGDVIQYFTRGDNPKITENDSRWKAPSDIKAVYVGKIRGLGAALDWIREPGSGHIIYVIIIPLAVLLIYNIYLVAQILIESKVKKAKALAAENAKQAALASIDEEEIKRKAIEEYLKSQGLAASPEEEPSKKEDTE